jgi:hypothetical protein
VVASLGGDESNQRIGDQLDESLGSEEGSHSAVLHDDVVIGAIPGGRFGGKVIKLFFFFVTK